VVPVVPWKDSTERVLWWLIAGTKGGRTRATIITSLKEMPRNPNQLAHDLGLDYKTVRHHLDVLTKNGLVSTTGNGYGTTFFLSPDLEEEYSKFEQIWSKIGKNKKSNSGGT
jgi:DNA-binding transcriptional ArsR family regulator